MSLLEGPVREVAGHGLLGRWPGHGMARDIKSAVSEVLFKSSYNPLVL